MSAGAAEMHNDPGIPATEMPLPKHSAPPTFFFLGTHTPCLECNIYVANVPCAQPPAPTRVRSGALDPCRIKALRLGDTGSLNVDISEETFPSSERLPSRLVLAPSDVGLSALQDKQIQPLGIEVGRNIQQHVKAQAGDGFLGAGALDPHQAGSLSPLYHLRAPCKREDNYISPQRTITKWEAQWSRRPFFFFFYVMQQLRGDVNDP